MASEDRAGKWRKIIFIVIAILVVLMILIGFLVGFASLKQFFKWVIGAILFLLILFGLFYVFWLIFIKKEFKDIPANYKRKLIQTAKIMRNEMLGELYLTGDSKHNRIKLGKYAYLRIQLPRQVTEQVHKPGALKPEIKEHTEVVDVDCFVLVKTGFFDYLFGQPMFVLVKPQDHNYSSIFNDVNINGFNLVPIDSQFYTINTRNLDIDIIKGMSTNYIREVVHEIFRDLDKLVKMSINLDQQFQKDKEKGREFEIPQLPMVGGGQQK